MSRWDILTSLAAGVLLYVVFKALEPNAMWLTLSAYLIGFSHSWLSSDHA